MNVCIAGLGLIGGSLALALKRAGHKVYGVNRSREHLDYALEHGVIDVAVKDNAEIRVCEVIFLALPPDACITFLKDNARYFARGAVVADICGVKKWMEEQVASLCGDFRYVGCHPMAGKEVVGVQNATADLFCNASMVVATRPDLDKNALEIIQSLVKDMGFARIVYCTADVHDRIIAYTSQLAHVISNSYVKDGDIFNSFGMTGGAFKDMTRIAEVEPEAWIPLYTKNSANLADKIDAMICALQEIKEAVIEGGDKLEKTLERGRERYLKSKKGASGAELTIKNLKD